MRAYWLLLIVTFTGCALGTSESTRNSSLGGKSDDRIVLTSAEQRALTVIGVDYDKDKRLIKPSRVLCAEPSPDIARAVSTALESSLKVEGKGKGVSGVIDASFDRTFTESIAQLGTRLATIQLLRDELSDLCRAYANGAVSSITYTLRLSRLDKKMITLLVSEASAGALSRALVSVNGLASSGRHASAEALKDAEERISEAAKAVTEASTTLNQANLELDGQKAGPIKEVDKKEVLKAKNNLQDRLNELNDRVLEKFVLGTRGTGLLVASNVSAIAELPSQSMSALDLRSIHKSYLDNDDLGTILDACLTSMEENVNASATSEIKMAENSLDEKHKELEKAQEDLAYANARLDALNTQNKSTLNPSSADRQQLLEELDKKKQLATTVSSEVTQLTTSLEDMRRSVDRTGLLTFCRREDGMKTVLRLLEKKMDYLHKREVKKNNAELCKRVIESDSVPPETIKTCINALVSD